MHIAVVVCFQNEERFISTTLRSLAAQQRLPDSVVLVDDGSTDRSSDMALAFVTEHGFAHYVRLPVRPPTQDRLADAAVVRAFQQGVEAVDSDWDVVTKMDGDLDLPPSLLVAVEQAFASDERLGLCGSYLSIADDDGRLTRERNPSDHVRGPNKFYRRACYADISPIPAILGWDTIDELTARLHGWRTQSLELPDRDVVHLRPTGALDGALRGARRHGVCAWGYGADARYVLASTCRRMIDRPYGLGAASFLMGWLRAAVLHLPRAAPQVRTQARREEMNRLHSAARRLYRARPIRAGYSEG